MTNNLYSLPNDWWRLLRFSGSISLHQPTARKGPSSRTWRQSRAGGSDGCNRAAKSILSGRASRHHTCLHGRTEADFCAGGRIGWSNCANCGLRQVAERQTKGSGYGRVKLKSLLESSGSLKN